MQMTLNVAIFFYCVFSTSALVSAKTLEVFADDNVAEASVDMAVKKFDANSSDVVPFEVESKRYLFVLKKRSWEDSEGYCKSRGMHLATIPSDLLYRNIVIKIRGDSRLAYRDFWIGARSFSNPYEWMWICGFENVRYTNWRIGEPNYGAVPPGPEYCVHLRKDDNLWNNESCKAELYSICGQCKY